MGYKIFCFIVFIGFMGACTHKTNEYIFDEVRSVKIDESEIVLTRFPAEMKKINDSVVGAINSAQSVSLYNIYSGKNIANFNLKKTNFDSLIQNTFQTKYADSKTYTYSNGFELNGENYQLTAFDYSNNRFWIHASVIVEVHHLKEDAKTLPKHKNNEKIIELQKQYDSINIIEMGYLNFLFETDNNFVVKAIHPLYGEEALKANNYFPYYNKGFFIFNNCIYTPIGKMDESFNRLENKLNVSADNYCLAKINLLDTDKIAYKLHLSNINFSDYTLRDYIEARFRFKEYKSNFLFSNGKEISEIENEKKMLDKKILSANEWIADFCFLENESLALITYEIVKMQTVDPAKPVFPKYKIKIIDPISSLVLKEQSLDIKSSTVTLTENKVIYLDRDHQNYYFKQINYHEK